ncbi:MAG TPA: pyroglutamyl-peptidase I [Xanthobacteraceae bacterium]
MTTALVLGFGPFPGAPSNPSAKLVRALARRRRPALSETTIVAAVLPTTYVAVARDLPELLKRHDPDVVLFFGLASRAEFPRIESRAVNAASAVHADAARFKPSAKQIIGGAPAALPVRALLQQTAAAMRGAHVVVQHSRDAGRYICNAALFSALDSARRAGRPKQIAFIHIPQPRTRARSRQPAMADLVRAGEAALVALVSANKRS